MAEGIEIHPALVKIVLVGSTYIDSQGRLIVDDTDVVAAFRGKWGGLKQQGVLTLVWQPFTVASVEVRPDAGGAYAPPGEPQGS